ncbi:MAG: hypothetical protein VXU42_06225, partial [Verrucomicrobiota bacterium]|nr:hypothetical protein [Verrucomicrobiota bacterium]
MVLATSQTVVSITIACGYVVTFGEIKGVRLGWLLLAINILVVAGSIAQQWFEELHLLLDAILAQKTFDPETVARLSCGNSLGAISDALLKSACMCLGNVVNGNDATADRYFRYLTKNLLSLKDSDARLLWDLEVPVGVHWVPHVQKHLSSAIDEFFASKEALLGRDLEGCAVAARAIFGSLVNEADARATFQILQEEKIDHYSRFGGQDVSFSAGIVRPRGRSSFAGENCFIEMVDGVGSTNTQDEGSAVASIEFENDIERGPGISSAGSAIAFGAPPVASGDDDDNDKDKGEMVVLGAINSTEIEARELHAATSKQQLSNDEMNISS